MGRARYLWDKNAELKKKMTALETERQELEDRQTQTKGEMRSLRRQIGELVGEGERPQQQLEEARAPPPAARPNTPEAAPDDSIEPGLVVDQLRQECKWVRAEREALRLQIHKLQATNLELGRNLEQANFTIDMCLP